MFSATLNSSGDINVKKKSKTATMKRRGLKKGKADKRQNPSAKVAHRAAAKQKRKRAPRAVAPPPREVGLLDAIGEVISICEELGQEMRDWADNMPESKQSSQKHDDVEQCADTLEEQAGNDPVTSDTMTFLNEVKVSIQDPKPSRLPRSRSARLGEGTDILTDVIEKLTEYIGDKTGPNETIAGDLKDSLEEIESELQGVEFPGMFG